MGHWLYEKHYWSGRFSSTTMKRLLFGADGRFTERRGLIADLEQHPTPGADAGAYGDGSPEVTGNMTMETDPNTDHGRWSAANGKLYLSYDDGSFAEYAYELSQDGDGRSMLMRAAGGSNELWTYQG